MHVHGPYDVVHGLLRNCIIAVHHDADVLILNAGDTSARHDEGRSAVVGDAVVLQAEVLVELRQLHGLRPCLIAVEARHHQMAVHHEVGQLHGVFVSHPAAFLDGALLPYNYCLTVIGHSQTWPVGSGLGRTVDRLGLVPLGTGVLLGVVEVIDAADLVHRHVKRQRILELLLGDCRSSLLHHRQVKTGH